MHNLRWLGSNGKERAMVLRKQIEEYSDDELHLELIRRAKSDVQRDMTEDAGSSNLPVGAWGTAPVNPYTVHNTPEDELTEIAKLARARTREILSILIDPTADNVAAIVRNINVAASTVLALVSKLKPPQPDRMPEILKGIQETSAIIWKSYGKPELVERLVHVSDEELAEAIAARLDFLKSEHGRSYAQSTPSDDDRRQFIREWKR
jgi:hypothetical protein